MASSLYNLRLENKEIQEPVWATYNAIYANNKWYVDDICVSTGDIYPSDNIIVKYYGTSCCMYPLDTDKYDILQNVTKIGEVELVNPSITKEI